MGVLKNLFDIIRQYAPSIHKEGFVFIYIFAGVSMLLGFFVEPLGWIGAICTIWCVYFFRDPKRTVPQIEGAVISPADGFVQKIEMATPPEELGLGDKKLTRISIFLNIFDVHVNRIPVDGEVTVHRYHPGLFLSANLDKASDDNERNSIVITTKDNKQVVCVQIAGLVARRIVYDIHEGQKVEAGDRYGIIRFGSRADIYLPDGVNPLVAVGQRAVGGETILANLKGKYEALQGEVK